MWHLGFEGHLVVDHSGPRNQLADADLPSHALVMFVVTDADAAAICTAFDQRGEFSAAVELRRRFPAITDNEQARECVRTIAAGSRWHCARPDGPEGCNPAKRGSRSSMHPGVISGVVTNQ